MSLNLQLLNLFIGLCKGVAGLPSNFRQLGFQTKLIEFRFQNSASEAVVPELIISSRQVQHTILFEWKEGANTQADQLRRYSRITAQDLIQRAMLRAEECTSRDVSIVGLEEHSDRLLIGITNGGYPFPVLVVTDAGLEKIHNQFSNSDTDGIFQPTLEINWDLVPTDFFPVDSQSEDWEYAELILPYIFTQMESGAVHILAVDFARAHIPLWNTANQNFHDQIIKKIVTVLDYSARHGLQAYIRRNRQLEGRTHSPTWEIFENPLINLLDRRLKVWKTMQKVQKQIIGHFRGEPIQEDLPLEDGR